MFGNCSRCLRDLCIAQSARQGLWSFSTVSTVHSRGAAFSDQRTVLSRTEIIEPTQPLDVLKQYWGFSDFR